MKFVKIIDPKLNTISFSMVFAMGTVHEPKEVQGITHLVEHLVFREAKGLSQKEIYEFFESRGVDIKATVGFNFTEFSFVCVKEVFLEIISLLHKLLLYTDYSPESIDLEKKIIAKEKQLYPKSNLEIATQNRIRYIIENDALDTLTAKNIKVYKEKFLKANSLCVICGGVSEEICDQVERIFEDFCEETTSFPREDKPFGGVTLVKDKFSMVDLYFSFFLPIKQESLIESVTIRLLNDILFKGKTSIVGFELREQAGLIYQVDSLCLQMQTGVSLGFSLSVSNKELFSTIEHLRNILDFEIESKYLDIAKAFYCNNLPMLQENPTLACDCIVETFISFNNPLTPLQYAEIVNSVSIDLCNRLWKEMKSSIELCVFGKVKSKEIEQIANIFSIKKHN